MDSQPKDNLAGAAMRVEPDILYISAPVNALVEGIFQADTRLGEIRRHGDFALGTFNHLDGEMVMLDGHTYQVTGTGEVHPVSDDVCSPFAIATFFRELSRDDLAEGFSSVEDLFAKLGQLFPSENMMYALRIDGCFSLVRTRSVPRQEHYRPLVEITRNQPTFERADVEGSLIGFHTPSFMSSLNVPGIHLHFLSDDRTFGGHLLQCRARHARVRLQILRRLRMDLPTSLAYLTTDFSRDTAGDLAEAESEKKAPATPA
ncbi:MAG: acetolactate decarboxylase [bacterium]